MSEDRRHTLFHVEQRQSVVPVSLLQAIETSAV